MGRCGDIAYDKGNNGKGQRAPQTIRILQRMEVTNTNFYENELKKMIRGIPFIQSYTFVGRTILGRLDEDLRVKISLVTTGIADHYNALQIHIINRTGGNVDTQIVKFRELLGKGFAIDDDSDGPGWGQWQPTQSDYIKVNQFLYNYISYYAPEQEPEEKQDMGGQNM